MSLFTHVSSPRAGKAAFLSLSVLFALLLLQPLMPQEFNLKSAAAGSSMDTSELQIGSAAAVTTTIHLPAVMNPPLPTKILFASDRDKAFDYDFDLYTMNLDGSGLQRITDIGERDNSTTKFPWATWSPDGSKIAYIMNRKLYVVNYDGTNHQTVVDNPDHLAWGVPKWSPDSSKIAFASAKCNNPPICNSLSSAESGFSLYQFESDQVNLVIARGAPFFDSPDENQPQWLPDGSAFLVAEYGGENSSLYKVYADGSPEEELFSGINFSIGGSIRISPDGTKLAFVNEDVFVINMDGSGLKTLHDSSAYGKYIYELSWHPDGQHIAMLLYKGFLKETEIHNIDIETLERVNLTAFDTTSTKFMYGWTADGSQLIYTSNWRSVLNMTFDVYIVNADGSNPVNLTPNSPFTDDRVVDVYP